MFLGPPTRSDRNWAVKLQKMARGLKFRSLEVEELYYQCSENEGADQLGGYPQLICSFVFVYSKKQVFL